MTSIGDIARKNFGLPDQQKDNSDQKKQEIDPEYIKKVYDDKPKNKELNITELKESFIKNSNALIKNISPDRSFIVDEHNKELMNCLMRYFTQDERFKEYSCVLKQIDEGGYSIETNPSINKGLMIVGNYGFGKTLTFKAFQRCFLHANSVNKFGIVSSMEITSRYESKELQNLGKYYKAQWYFDDVGQEKKAFNSKELMEDIIFQRYHLFQNTGKKTHMTTNFGLNYLKNKYGDYIYSRIFEMFNIIVVDGVDRRKTK